MDISRKILSDVILHMKYARYLPEKQRRETWDEVVTRNMNMHLAKFPQLEREIRDAYRYVYERKVLPSMRTMQFSGRPIDLNASRGYNCAYTPIDNVDAFSEAMFLLLGGTGVGYSVQEHHIEKLPPVRGPIRAEEDGGKNRRYLINDSLEGWAETIKMLMESYFFGKKDIDFDYRDIRQKGAQLLTAGGKAPGPQPLKDCVHNIRKILDGALQDRGKNCKLTSLEIHDIMCYIADAVLSGGIRRSAMIAFFSYDDTDMLNCKSGPYWETNSQRGRANNSVVLLRHKLTKDTFSKLWERVRQSGTGEPGIYLTNDKNMLSNPCVEASLHENTFCNLVTALVSDIDTQAEFNTRCRVASFLSTLQASYTDFHYLREVWRKNTERDALLGISMTGIATQEFLDNVDLTEGVKIVLEENERVAKLIGINKATRTTLVKPDGCRPYNALVTTTEGLMTLQELFKDHIEGEEWCAYKGTARSIQADGSSEEITQTYSNGESDIYKITLAGQIELECTANHPWFVKEHFNHSKGIRYAPVNAFKNTTDLQIGDILDINLGAYTKEQHSLLHPTNFFSLRMAPDTMSRITQPTEMSSDLAWLLGYLWGDGCLSENKYRLRFIDEHVWNLEKAQRILKDIFGLEANLHKCTDRNAHTLEVGSIELWTWFSDHGIRKYTSATMDNIPLCVRTSSKEDIIAFIAGFADADGCVYKKTATQRALMLSQTERFGFTRHLQNIALAVGLHFNHSYNRGGQNFQANKCMILMSMSSFSLAGSVDMFCKHSEKAQHKFPELSFEGKGYIHMNLGKVVSIEKVRRERTYDIEVANTHEFYAGAVRSHNTSSLLLGCSSGIHAWYDKYYIRRIRVGKNEAIYTYFAVNNPELLEDDAIAKDTAIIVLPIKAPDGAITRNETASDTLERVKRVYNEWIVPGHRKGSNTHNSSVTINIKPDEWDTVRDWMWENRSHYNGISVLPHDNGIYVQAPFESITEERYNAMMLKVHDIDLSQVWEAHDKTNLTGEIACGGGACEIR